MRAGLFNPYRSGVTKEKSCSELFLFRPFLAEQSSLALCRTELSRDCASSTSEDLGSSGRQLVQPLVIAPLATGSDCIVLQFSPNYPHLFHRLTSAKVSVTEGGLTDEQRDVRQVHEQA